MNNGCAETAGSLLPLYQSSSSAEESGFSGTGSYLHWQSQSLTARAISFWFQERFTVYLNFKINSKQQVVAFKLSGVGWLAPQAQDSRCQDYWHLFKNGVKVKKKKIPLVVLPSQQPLSILSPSLSVCVCVSVCLSVSHFLSSTPLPCPSCLWPPLLPSPSSEFLREEGQESPALETETVPCCPLGSWHSRRKHLSSLSPPRMILITCTCSVILSPRLSRKIQKLELLITKAWVC